MFHNFKPSFNWNRFYNTFFLSLSLTLSLKIRKSANSTLLYLIENGFLDKKVINRTVCPVILDLLKVDKADGVNGEYDIQLNAIGVSFSHDFIICSGCDRKAEHTALSRKLLCTHLLRNRSNEVELKRVISCSIRKMATVLSLKTFRVCGLCGKWNADKFEIQQRFSNRSKFHAVNYSFLSVLIMLTCRGQQLQVR